MKSGRLLISPLLALPLLAVSSVSSLQAASDDTIYAKVIHPILEARCIECHGEKKSKGKLRLDSPEHITKGEVVVAGKSGESELFNRVTLPKDDDDIMPPKGDPLTKDQIDVLKWWVDEQKGSFEAKFVIAEVPDVVKKLAENAPAASAAKSKEPELPEVAAADPALLKPLQDLGVLVLPLAQNTNLLHVESVSVAKDIKDEHLALLGPLAPQLAWLYLNKTQVTDAGIKHLAGLKQLRRLHLANTGITNAGVKHLEGLENLETLNIYGTKVSDDVLASLAKLPKLKKVFLYSTEVSPRVAFRFLNKNPNLDVNLGWDFEALKNLDVGMTHQDAFDENASGAVQGGKLTYGDGPSGKAAKFDGKAFIVAGDLANFEHTDAFSVAAWVKGEAQEDGVIAARSDSSDADRGWAVSVANGTIGFQLASNVADNAIKTHAHATMDKDAWYHVVATYDGSGKAGGVKLYMDSVVLSGEVDQDNLSSTTKTYKVMNVGRRSDGAIFKGEMDDLRVYPEALSPDQIGALFDRYGHKEVPAVKAAEGGAAQADNGKVDVVVALASLFDDGSCCHKAHAKDEACAHECCIKAAAEGKVCLKCNPGAEGKAVPAAKKQASSDAKGDVSVLIALFDDGSCCHKAHAKEDACKHPCCVKATAAGAVCLKCNPGAKGKVPEAKKAS
ncbi:MAG: hypothetical protein ACI9DF_005179 [Verrucomicrobiales bacterium]|jgi:hypothetical protein